jgi:uncharacterized protein (TIGR02118 family)
MTYYTTKHIPMVQQKLGIAVKSASIAVVLSGAAPESAAPYAVMAHLYSESVDAFKAAFGPHAEAIMGDIANYTNVPPIIQISEIVG